MKLTMTKSRFLDKAKGCLYGLAIGDAMGAPVEGWDAIRIKKTYGWLDDLSGEAQAGTDDTEFTMLTLMSILKSGGLPTEATLAKMWLEHCRDWPETRNLMTPGCMSEKRAVANLLDGKLPPLSGRDSMAGDSCGAAMRIAPCGVMNPGRPDLAKTYAEREASVSHAGEGVYQAQLVAVAVSLAMIDADIDVIMSTALASIPEDSWTRRTFDHCVRAGGRSRGKHARAQALWRVSDTGCPASHGPGATSIALASFCLGRGEYRDSVELAVNSGRDADSSAAQVGAICGALCGYRKLPAPLKRKIGPLEGRHLKSMQGLHIDDVLMKMFDTYEKNHDQRW